MSRVRMGFLLLATGAVMSACGGGHSALMPTGGGSPIGDANSGTGALFGVTPNVWQNGNHGGFVVFAPKTNSPTGSQYKSIVSGPDKNIWVLDQGNNALAKITMTGRATEFPLAMISSSLLDSLAVGTDKKFYIPTGASPGIVETVTTTGAVQALSIPSGDAALSGVTKGPDGNIWFSEYHHIGVLTPAGAFTEYTYPGGISISVGGDITTGSDGNLWFAFVTFSGSFVGNVMKIVPATGAMTIYSLGSVGCQYDQGIVNGPDGNLWVDCGAHIVRVDTSGNALAFPVTNPVGLTLGDITVGSGNLLWYVGAQSGGQLVSFDVVTHTETAHSPPTGANTPYHVTRGPDQNIWFTGFGSASQPPPTLGIHLQNVLSVSPKKATLSGPSQMQTLTVTESGITAWTASSSKKSVATVAQGSPSNTFVVTAVGVGTATITIMDAMLNSYKVTVTVL